MRIMSIYSLLFVVAFIGCSDEKPNTGNQSVDLSRDQGTELDMTPLQLPDQGDRRASFGEPCEENSDCESQYCLTTSDGKICTQVCSDVCPGGLTCSPVDRTQTPPLYLCLSDLDKLCQPCEVNEDCQSISDRTDLCLNYGDQGNFCGVDCRNLACPDGYECSMEPLPNGTILPQCRLINAECRCTLTSRSSQASTSCAVSNEFGRCEGVRQCGFTGLTLCDAPAPQAEVCNGRDDNCNGAVDELDTVPCEISNELGTCTGYKGCDGSTELCEAQTPSAETCDGVDNDCDGAIDEGFADLDEDGLIDCSEDDDDDNDSVVDALDNCPSVANPDQLDTDSDTLGDLCDPDDDGDGTPDAMDCAPLDAQVYPGAVEVCDGKDNECDTFIDEGSCDDQNPCTDDICDLEQGCVHTFNESPCNDRNACTTSDRCVFGECSGVFLSCDDGNICTQDVCDPAVGCRSTVVPDAPCNDNDPCTAADRCSATGLCVGDSLNCECRTDRDCLAVDDGNLCNGTPSCNTSQAPYRCVNNPS
jgi:hypothetical protein